MKAAPGGYVAPADVIGRDALIDWIWQILDDQSLVLTAERRIGKTTILNKMDAERKRFGTFIKHDLSNIHTRAEFAEQVLEDVKGHLSPTHRALRRLDRLHGRLAGAQVGPVKLPSAITPPWRVLVERALRDIAADRKHTIFLFWDEFPLMIQNIRNGEGNGEATEVLNTLRALRGEVPLLRMVYTGSIGLHHVITSLKRAGYSITPTNDMMSVEVPPLAAPDAQTLACRLMADEKIPCDDLAAAGAALARAVDCVPFYIRHVVARLKQDGLHGSVESVNDLVCRSLTDPTYGWDLNHFIERIDVYYGVDERPFARTLLDVLSSSDRSLPFREVFNRFKTIRSANEDSDREAALRVLELLKSDHYVVQELDETYRFKFPLIQRYWHARHGVERE